MQSFLNPNPNFRPRSPSVYTAFMPTCFAPNMSRILGIGTAASPGAWIKVQILT